MYSAIAPGTDPSTVDPAADLREEIDLDSMDMLYLIIALYKRIDIDIPEVDAPKLITLDSAIEYFFAKVSARQ